MAETDSKGRPLVTPRPKARPDFDAPRYTDPVLRGEDGRIITIEDTTNPVTQLGQTMGDEFRVYEPTDLSARGVYVPPSLEEMGGPIEDSINVFYKEQYPNKRSINVDDVVLMGEGLNNSQTPAHEFMHRGFNLIREHFSEDELKERYGDRTAGIILNPNYEHYLVQAVLENEGQTSFNDYNDNLTDEGKETVRNLVDPLYELAREVSGEKGFITDRDRGPRTRPNNKPAESEKGFFAKLFGYAEGGVVLDPVSGNEVPPGSMPHEVRDDIDAKLSEGEYVVPADVVRYFGVKFFEDLRSKAKGELQEMHSGGRMGQPIDDDMPFSMEELHTFDDGEEEVPGFAEGGVVTQMELPDFLRGAGTGGAEEFRTYSNADGMLLTIRFVNGQPMSPIPPGYAPYDPTKEPTQDNLVTATESRSDGPDTQVGRSAQEEVEGAAKGLSNLSGEQMKDLTDFMTGKGGRIATGLASMTSFGALAGLGNRAITSAVAREAQTRFQNATTEEEKQQYFDIFTDATTRGKDVGDGIFGGGGIMGGGGTLNDNDNDGKRDLGDTWLGDLLGLDGKAGVQGANLSDSFNGARRTGGTGTQSKSLDNSRDTSSGAADDQGGGFWQGVKDFFGGNKDD